MTHADFLEFVLADEVTRREAKSASLRARASGLDPSMRLDTWDESAAAPCTWPPPTSCSNGSKPPGSITPWITRCAARDRCAKARIWGKARGKREPLTVS